MSVDGRVVSLIEKLYEAAVDESLWPSALERLAKLTGSQGATFWTLESAGQPRLPVFATFNFDPSFIRDYLDNMVPMDPTVQYLVAHPNTPIVHDGLIIAERQKDLSAYYDWQRRQCDINFRMVVQSRPVPDVQAGVALHRSRRVGRYEASDLDQFAFIHAHLQRALGIGIRLGALATMQACTTELLDRSQAAIVLLDEQKCVVYANRRAEEFRSGGDGVRLSARGIVLSRKQDNDRLRQVIARVLSATDAPGASAELIYAMRPSGKRPFCIAVARVTAGRNMLTAIRPAVCITISDPEAKTLLRVGHLAAAFGLTDAEARLAVLLGSGQRLRSAAHALGITYGTARTRLNQIFDKTHTRRQAELVGVLLAGLAPI